MTTTESPQGQPTEPIIPHVPAAPDEDDAQDLALTIAASHPDISLGNIMDVSRMVIAAGYTRRPVDTRPDDRKTVSEFVEWWNRNQGREDYFVAAGSKTPRRLLQDGFLRPDPAPAAEVPASSTPTRAELLALIDEHSSNAFKAAQESLVDKIVEQWGLA